MLCFCLAFLELLKVLNEVCHSSCMVSEQDLILLVELDFYNLKLLAQQRFHLTPPLCI